LNGSFETDFDVAGVRLDDVGTCIGPAGLGLNGKFDTGAALLEEGDDLTGSVVLDWNGEEPDLDGVRALFGEAGFVVGISKNGISILGIGEPMRAFSIAALVSASIGDASSKSPNSSSSSSSSRDTVVVVNSS
jgi:hypothetical protein